MGKIKIMKDQIENKKAQLARQKKWLCVNLINNNRLEKIVCLIKRLLLRNFIKNKSKKYCHSIITKSLYINI